MTSKAEIFGKYLNSKPANVQTPARSLEQVHADFLLFVKGYVAQMPAKVDTADITGSTKEIEFYKTALASLLHPVYGVFAQPSYGSANSQLYKLRRDGGTYRLEVYGINGGRSTVEISDARIELTEKSLLLFSNNGNSVRIELTGESFDVNKFVTGASPLVVPVWQLSVFKNNNLATRHQLVALTM